jgi:hypothetical protein
MKVSKNKKKIKLEGVPIEKIRKDLQIIYQSQNYNWK